MGPQHQRISQNEQFFRINSFPPTLQRIFIRMDHNGDGLISALEISQAIKSFESMQQSSITGEFDLKSLPNEMKQILNPLDSDNSGSISIHELSSAMHKYQISSHSEHGAFPIDAFPEELQDIIHPLDVDGDGT